MPPPGSGLGCSALAPGAGQWSGAASSVLRWWSCSDSRGRRRRNSPPTRGQLTCLWTRTGLWTAARWIASRRVTSRRVVGRWITSWRITGRRTTVRTLTARRLTLAAPSICLSDSDRQIVWQRSDSVHSRHPAPWGHPVPQAASNQVTSTLATSGPGHQASKPGAVRAHGAAASSCPDRRNSRSSRA